jgi:CubicO group peptidase (beta-lactamase class C family)
VLYTEEGEYGRTGKGVTVKRMIVPCTLVLALMAGLLAGCGRAEELTPTPPEAAIPSFEEELDRLRQELNIPGMSVAVLHRQQVIFASGFGYADIENRIPATENTPYNIASCTKPFAATVLMKLVESGQLDLDAAMADILSDVDFVFPETKIDGYADLCGQIEEWSKEASGPWSFLLEGYHCDTERITVRHHLTHTSQGVPGEAYRYNGFLYGLLTWVMEEVSGNSFAALLVENIIGPLGMTRTVPSRSESRDQQILAERAEYYRIDNDGSYVPSGFPVDLNAGGGIISTVLDLAKFDVAMDQDLIISEKSKEAMLTSTISNSGQPLPYGLGWFIQEHEGTRLVWHYGWAPEAYSSLILKVLDEELTLILLANSDGASAQFDLGAGNVLKSPFAVTFINQFTDMETTLQ